MIRTIRSNGRDKVRSPDPVKTSDTCYVDDRNKNYIIINSNHEISHITENGRESAKNALSRNAQNGQSKSAGKNLHLNGERGKDYQHVYFNTDNITSCKEDSAQGMKCNILYHYYKSFFRYCPFSFFSYKKKEYIK